MHDCPDPFAGPAAALAGRGRFFVVGCQKSGTTWALRLLDAHPQLLGCGETHLLDLLAPLFQDAANTYNRRQAQRVAEGRGEQIHEDDVLAALRRLADGIFARRLAAAAEPATVTSVGEKTPEHARAIPLLERLFPGARYVHVIRDGRDAAVSGWAHLARRGGRERFGSFPAYARYFAAHHWRPYIESARAAGAALGDRYCELRYERLHEDGATEARRAFACLGVRSDDDTVARVLDAASFRRLSGGRERGAEDPASFFRKGVSGEWREAFDDEALRAFDEEAGALLAELGYEPAAAAAG